MARQKLGPKKVRSGLKMEIKQLKAESSGLDKDHGLKKEKKTSFDLEKEIKQLRAESLVLDKAHGLKIKK